jgi:hypothetical protein
MGKDVVCCKARYAIELSQKEQQQPISNRSSSINQNQLASITRQSNHALKDKEYD